MAEERGPFPKGALSLAKLPSPPKTFVLVDNGAGQDGDRALNICPPVVWGERAVEAGQERRLRRAFAAFWGARTVFAHKRSAAALHEDIKMKKTICLLPGDGMVLRSWAQGVAVLEAVAKKFGHEFDFVPASSRRRGYRRHWRALPAATVEACQKADAVYLGAVGGPERGDKYRSLPAVLKRACWASARPWACSPTCVPPCCCPNWPAPACCVPTSRPAVWTSSWCAS